MKSVQRGKLPASIALSRSRPLLSRSLATRASASASVRFAIPCWVRKWNLTQMRCVRGIDHRKCVAAEQVHMAEALRDAAVRHRDGDLVQSLGQQCPEVPIIVRT